LRQSQARTKRKKGSQGNRCHFHFRFLSDQEPTATNEKKVSSFGATDAVR
jgi:hypothetical protein